MGDGEAACKRVRDALYADDKLEPDAIEHLESCSACQDLRDRLSRMDSAFRADFLKKLLARVGKEPITPPLLDAYLRLRIERPPGNAWTIIRLVNELERYGITQLDDVEKMLKLTEPSFLAQEPEHPPTGATRYTGAGVVRVCLNMLVQKVRTDDHD